MTQLVDVILPDAHVTFSELCLSANISSEYMIELIDYEVVLPISGSEPLEWRFNITAVIKVNKAARLHRDLDISWADISLVLNLIEEIESLKNENHQLKQQLNRFFVRPN